jgi:hypothetical protein
VRERIRESIKYINTESITKMGSNRERRRMLRVAMFPLGGLRLQCSILGRKSTESPGGRLLFFTRCVKERDRERERKREKREQLRGLNSGESVVWLVGAVMQEMQ